jgi:DNA-binding PadR family transcriptional regulator
MGDRRGAYSILVEGRRPLGRPRHKWEDIKLDLQEEGWGGMYWTDLAKEKDRGSRLV